MSLPIFAVLMTSAVYAASFSTQPFTKTVQDAPVIVRGKVGTNSADWGKDADGIKRLYTFYELQVSEVFKGDATTPTLTMRELGGEKDGMGMQISGASQYEKGEDVVVLLKDKNPDGSFDVQGMMMGKYNIQTDPDGNETLMGAGLMGQENIAAENPSEPKKWTLETLRQTIRTQAQNPPPQKSQPVQEISPSPSEPHPLSAPSVAAPQLQTQDSPDSSPVRSVLYYGIGLGLVGVLIAWMKKRHKT